jgi:hypothetical protein
LAFAATLAPSSEEQQGSGMKCSFILDQFIRRPVVVKLLWWPTCEAHSDSLSSRGHQFRRRQISGKLAPPRPIPRGQAFPVVVRIDYRQRPAGFGPRAASICRPTTWKRRRRSQPSGDAAATLPQPRPILRPDDSRSRTGLTGGCKAAPEGMRHGGD